MTPRRLRSQILSICIGVLFTAMVLIVYLSGHLDWLEWKTYDLRVGFTNSTPVDPRIALIEIDDESLTRFGRWPWTRSLQAEIFNVLREAGARAILVDLNWIEGEPVSVQQPPLADFELRPGGARGDRLEIDYPDYELRGSIRRAGNVYLAVDYPLQATKEEREFVARRVRVAALQKEVADWINARNPPLHQPETWWRELYSAMTNRSPDDDTPFRSDFEEALRRELGWRAIVQTAPVASISAASAAQVVSSINPAHFRLAQVARGFGFVVFDPDGDGVVRRVPLFVVDRGRMFAQLGVAVACDVLGVDLNRVRVSANGVVLDRSAAGLSPLRIQLEGAQTLIPWPGAGRFGRIPAHALLVVPQDEAKMQENTRVIRDTTERVLVSLVNDAETYASHLAELKAARQRFEAHLLASDGAGSSELPERIKSLETAVATAEQEALQKLENRRHELLNSDPTGLELENLSFLASELARNEPYEHANAILARGIAHNRAELRGRIEGKICLVGYTATALADFIPTPTDRRAAGVRAHACMLNSILTGTCVSWSTLPTNIVLLLFMGIAATVITALRPLKQSAPIVALALIGLVGAAVWLFYAFTYWLAVMPPVIAAVAGFSAISLYQYAFVDRERRHLAAALGQYTSRTIAKQVAENPELCKKAETRDVTTMFTDLRGFTQISERIGAARTQQVLNACLGRFTEVLIKHEGMVNKFLGDGVFAFWNPVIYPQPDHARRACEAALELVVALRELVRERAAENGDDAFAELELRIGIATGTAVVGPCGSEQKYDYTCIGDSVNVSARLESANKFYGTTILVSGATRDAVGDEFVFRSLGAVQVKGKRHTVQVFELLGKAGQVDGGVLAYSERFGKAVECFQRRSFDLACAALGDCLAQRPADPAALAYHRAIEHCRAHPPGDEWTGSLELAEK